MKTFTLTSILLLCATLIGNAANVPHINGSVTYSQSIGGNGGNPADGNYPLYTGGVIRFDLTVPMSIDLSEIDETTTLSLQLAPFYDPNTSSGFPWADRVYTLRDDPKYASGKTSASISDYTKQINISWTASSLTVSGYLVGSVPISSYEFPDGIPSQPGQFSGLGRLAVGFGSSLFTHDLQAYGTNTIKTTPTFDPALGTFIQVLKGNIVMSTDMTAPVVTIKSPQQGLVTTNDFLTVSFLASDNTQLGSVDGNDIVTVQPVNDNAFNASLNMSVSQYDPRHAAGTCDISGLLCGTNTFRFTTVDASGNYSSTDFTVFLSCAAPISLSVDGGGHISGATDGQSLIIGRRYTFVAVPAAGKVFAGWYSGDSFVSQYATNTFTMAGDLTLTAKFIDNPFPPLVGSYSALYSYDQSQYAPDLQTSGAINFTVTSSGTFSGKLTTYAGTTSVTGKFVPTIDAGTFCTIPVVLNSVTNTMFLFLDTDLASSTYARVDGVVLFSDGNPDAPSVGISGAKIATNVNVLQAGAGVYNFYLDADTANNIGGSTFGTVTINQNAVVTSGSLNLADDAPVIALTGSVTVDGNINICIPLYHGNGLFFGSLAVGSAAAPSPLATMNNIGQFSWIKNPGQTSLPDGFISFNVSAWGSKYVPPTIGSTFSGMIAYGGAGLDSKSKAVAVNSKGIVSVTDEGGNEDHVASTINFANGQYSGTFTDGPIKRPFKGILTGYDDSSTLISRGYFLRDNQSGSANFDLFAN